MTQPATIAEIEAVIGLALTLKLIEAFGGTTIRLPARANIHPDNAIAQIIGINALRALVDALGASRWLYIARCAEGVRLKRNQTIVRQYNAGASVNSLALQHRLADRTIWEILKNTDMANPQQGLF
jgi:Mor family transcriptional regulator